MLARRLARLPNEYSSFPFQIPPPVGAWKFNRETPKILIDGWCQIAIMEVGRGRVAVFGEAVMFTAQLSGARKAPIVMNSPHAR